MKTKKAYLHPLVIAPIIALIVITLFATNPVSLFAAEKNSAFKQVKVYPVDDTEENLSFMEFKLNLLKAIEEKDSDFIYSIVTPESNFSFGGYQGPEGLEKLWKLKSDPESDFWPILERILKIGCVSENRPNGEWYIAPYTFTNFPGDGSMHLVVLGHNVNLRKDPNLNGEVLEKLDYEVVKMYDYRNYDPMAEWSRVVSPSGRVGYISNKYVISPLYYRTGFKKTDDGWKMQFFVSGD